MKFPWMEREEDFAVEEILDKKFLMRFTRGRDVKRMAGNYSLCTIKKIGVTTEEAARRIAKFAGVKRKDVGYAGLKDKFAVAVQYVTVKGDIGDYASRELSMKKIASVNRPIAVGDLSGNKFNIKIPAVARKPEALVVRNYFGSQRFGSRGNNHIIGRLMLQGRFNDALAEINKHSETKYKNISAVEKKRLKFYINAYQSYIFNRCLESLKKPYFGLVAVPGYETRFAGTFGKLARLLLEKDSLTAKSFRIDELRIRADGAKRKAFIKVKMRYESDRAIFELPKGSYASVVISELLRRKKL